MTGESAFVIINMENQLEGSFCLFPADSFFLADAIGRAQGLDAWERFGLAAAIESSENEAEADDDYADEPDDEDEWDD